jgi:phenylalanyl-tRNA synthetase beta chain
LENIELDFLKIREEFFGLFWYLNLKKGKLKQTSRSYFHPNAGLELEYEGKLVAEFGILHERYADSYDLKRRCFIGKCDLLALVALWEAEGRTSHFYAPSQFPEGQLDLSVIMLENEPTNRLVEVVESLKIPELQNLWVHTIYRGESLGEGKKSVTYRFQLMSYEKTFTQERFKELSDTLIATAKANDFSIR